MKKVGKIFIVLILLLAIAGGALAYAYYYTDLFKSNKEMFFTYIMQNGDVISLFDEPGVAQISKKQSSEKHTISSKIDVEYPDEKIIDDLNIVLNGKTDLSTNQHDYEINFNYNEEVGMPFRIVIDNNTLAVTSKDAISQFIGVKNENLKDLAEKFGMDSTDIPDKIEFEMPDYTKYYFTENEKSVVNYKELITNKFMEESFTKAKTEDGNTIYTLTTTTNVAKEVCVGVLEAVKGENLIINKIVEILNDVSKSEEKITAQDILDSIDDMITDINETEIKEKEIKINLYVANKELLKTEVLAEGFNLMLVANENKFEYDVQTNTEEDNSRIIFSMNKTRAEDNLKYVIATKFFSDDIEILNLDIDYAINGIDTQNKVTIDTMVNGKIINSNSEEYTHYSNVVQDLELAEFYASNEEYAEFAPEAEYTEADLENAKNQLKEVDMLGAGLKISSTTDFTADVTFEVLNDTNLIALNDYEYDVLVNVFGQVVSQISKVHADKLKEAGLESDPYLVVPTLIMGTGMYIYNSSVSSINQAMDAMESNQNDYNYNDYDYDYDNDTNSSIESFDYNTITSPELPDIEGNEYSF